MTKLNAPTLSPLATAEPWDLVSEGYVAELWGQFSSYARSALELARVAPGAEVLDVAAGPGTLAVQAARTARHVVAVDFSPRMLDELGRRARELALSNIEPLHADGQALPLAEARFDAAFSMFGLIFFPERARGFGELLRVLRPGGRAVVASWRPFSTVPPIQAAFEFLLELMPELPFGKSKAPLGEPDEFRAELEQAGFRDIEIHVVSHAQTAPGPEALWASMTRSTAPFVLLRRRIGEERWRSLSDRIQTRLTERFGTGPLTLAPEALLGTGTKPGNSA